MNEVTDVLMKSQDIPSLPFKGELRYEGITFYFRVLGTYYNDKYHSVSDMDKIFEESSKFDATKLYTDKTVEEKVGNSINPENPVEDITKIPTRNDITDGDYVAYLYDNNIYIIEPFYKFIYSVKINGITSDYYCVEQNTYRDVPESTPQPNMSVVFTDDKTGLVKVKSSNILNKVFGITNLEFKVKFNEKFEYYDRYELINNVSSLSSKQNNNTDYSPASVNVSDNKFIIDTKYNNENITFEIPLTNVGTLPEWATEKLDIKMLLSVIDSDDTLMAHIKPTEQKSKWKAKDKNYTIVKLE